MKINKLAIVAAAVAGLIACGSIVRAQDAKEGNKDSKDAPGRPPNREGGPRGGGDFTKQRLERMTAELKLTDEQKPKVEAALKETGDKMRKLREDSNLSQEDRREKMKGIMEE